MDNKQGSLGAPSTTPTKSCLFSFSSMRGYAVSNLSPFSPLPLFSFRPTSCLGRLRLRGRNNFAQRDQMSSFQTVSQQFQWTYWSRRASTDLRGHVSDLRGRVEAEARMVLWPRYFLWSLCRCNQWCSQCPPSGPDPPTNRPRRHLFRTREALPSRLDPLVNGNGEGPLPT